MSETQLKKLKAEKDRLDAEAEAVKELITVSAACQELVNHVNTVNEPFDQAAGSNPFTKKIASSTCSVV